MASLPAEEKVEFLIQLLVTSGEFSPNYPALAKVMGINTNSNAQRRFKGIVEADKRFALKAAGSATRIIQLDQDGKADDGTENEEKATKTPNTGKGRKRMRAEDDKDADKTPSKVSKKSKTTKATEVQDDVVEPDQDVTAVDEEAV